MDSKAAASTIVGITGHQNIREKDEIRVKSELKKRLGELRTTFGNQLVIITGNAKGVDSIAWEIAAEENIAIKSLEVIVLPEKDLEGNVTLGDQYLQKQAEYIVNNANVIIAVWDGIYTHKLGGTSEVVRLALESNREIHLHHLVCPRVSNVYPVNTLASDAIDFNSKQFTRLPFTTSFSWTYKVLNPAIAKSLPISQKLTNLRRHFFKADDNGPTFNYLVPLSLAIFTVLAGFFGFYISRDEISIDNFFRAVLLITLDESVLGDDTKTNVLLNIARFAGLATTVSAFAYALILALGKTLEVRKRNKWAKKGFALVLGLNEKSFDLIKDLTTDKSNRVVLLSNERGSVYIDELKQLTNMSIVYGSLSSYNTLRAIHALAATNVFIMSDSDTENVRAMQELSIMVKKDAAPMPQFFVHVQQEDYRKFLQSGLTDAVKCRTFIFNIYENTVRRLLLHYPPDRFYQNPAIKNIHTFILGYGDLGKQLLTTLLKQGHYNQGRQMSITVICENSKACKLEFQKRYPLIETGENDFPALKNVKAYTWKNINIDFVDIPMSDNHWVQGDFLLYRAFALENIVNIYACLPDGIKSASCLHTILPKLNFLQGQTGCNAQVFCYYNFPDKAEERIVEQDFNALAPNVFVKCFGNFLDECSASAIQSMALDEVAKLIHARYNQLIDLEGDIPVEGTENKWINASEKDRISSRQAGDHFWVKLRLSKGIMERADGEYQKSIYEDDLNNLSEIEHRRWCADLLLQGFVPFDLDATSDAYQAAVTNWNKNKLEKTQYQLMKRHINLVPFDELEDSERRKDILQIEVIPKFLAHVLPMR